VYLSDIQLINIHICSKKFAVGKTNKVCAKKSIFLKSK